MSAAKGAVHIRTLLLRHGRGARSATGPAVRFLERNELDKRAGRPLSDEDLLVEGISAELWQGEGRLDDGRTVQTWLHMAVLEPTPAELRAEEEALARKRERKPSVQTI